MTARPPIEELVALFRSTVAREGVTTGAGDATGDSIIDAGLIGVGADSFVSMLLIVYPADFNNVESFDITAFNTITGEIDLNHAYKGVAAVIPAGVPYTIVTFRFVPAEVAAISALIGTAADAGDLGTLFGRNKRVVEAVHVHVLLVVGDTTAMDADLDTALQDFLEDKGYDVVVADPTDVFGNLELHFDAVIVSASCVAGDTANLAKLRTVLCPVICHSAAIAVSTVFNLGTTAGTEVNQTQIEIIDNTVQWFLEEAVGDLIVTIAATIYTMATKTANAITLAREDTGTGTDLTMVLLPQGQDDGGVVPYAPDFDRYFLGVANFTEINVAWVAILEEFYDHIIHETRFSPETVVTPKRVYQEDILDTGFSIAPDVTLASDPPGAEAENSVVDIDRKTNRTFVLRSLWVNVTDLGGGTLTMTFKLWIDIGGTATEVDAVDVTSTGYQNLVDIFGLQEVHADSIHITAQVNAGTGACAGIYRFAEAKR